jgi:hypothetical protein
MYEDETLGQGVHRGNLRDVRIEQEEFLLSFSGQVRVGKLDL